MGQTNDNEDPELILEKLKAMAINDEDNTSLDSSFQTIKKILTEYKLYKDIISKNDKHEKTDKNNKDKRRKSAFLINNFIFGANVEYSKNELMNFKGRYDKNVIQEVNHKLERIKKWVIMTKSSYLNEDENEKSFQSLEKKVKNNNKYNSSNNIRKLQKIDSKNSKNFRTSNKTIIISNYTDKKIENGITQFYVNQNDKFIERIKKGPPDCFRWTSWCIINNLPLDRDNRIYENYINMPLEKENKDRIIRDIKRTFSERNIDSKELRKMETSLYNVLKAFWNLDKEIGYCQGMNLLVGFLLIVSDFNERDTFYLLISKFSQTFKLQRNLEFNFRGLFSEEFPLLYFLNYIFDSQLELHSHNLKEHLNEMGITIDLWMGKWFQTLFTIILPINWCQRLWDNIFAENVFFIVKFGIAFTLMIKDDLMKMNEEVQILDYFKNFEKYSLSEKNDLLNEKCNIEALILKCKKIKIDMGIYLKNFEKSRENGKGFLYKMEKIEDVQYKLNKEIVKKATIRTVLFPDEESKESKSESNNNSKISKENSNKDVSEEEIFLEKNSKEIDNIINIRKNNRVKNLQINKMKKKFNGKNKLKSIDFSTLNQIPMTDRYLSNKLNIDKFKNEVLNKNNNNGTDGNSKNIQTDNNTSSNKNTIYLKKDINNNFDSNNNKKIKTEASNNETNKKNQISNDDSLSIVEDSINNTYYQNTEENLYNTENNNVINNNIETHRFGNILKENKFDYLTYKNKFDKSNTKNGESYFSPSFKRKREYFLGLHKEQKSGLTSFAQKHNFDMK